MGDVRQFGAWAALEFVQDKYSHRTNTRAQSDFAAAVLRRGVLGIGAPEKWVYRIQPALTMDLDLFRWSCEQIVDAVDEVLTGSSDRLGR